MASPSSVLSLGFGTWGSANLVVTLGYGSSEETIQLAGRFLELTGPYRAYYTLKGPQRSYPELAGPDKSQQTL